MLVSDSVFCDYYKEHSLKHVKSNISTIHKYLLDLFRSDVYIEVILESKIGKTLKFFVEFCKVYGSDLEEIKRLGAMAEQILMKWKNFINNIFFDDNVDNTKNFQKVKSLKKIN